MGQGCPPVLPSLSAADTALARKSAPCRLPGPCMRGFVRSTGQSRGRSHPSTDATPTTCWGHGRPCNPPLHWPRSVAAPPHAAATRCGVVWSRDHYILHVRPLGLEYSYSAINESILPSARGPSSMTRLLALRSIGVHSGPRLALCCHYGVVLCGRGMWASVLIG